MTRRRCTTWLRPALIASACLGLALMATAAGARADDLRVGAAMRVITPDPLLPVSGGMGIPRPSDKKLGELTARAIVFQKGETSVAVVSLDLLGFPSVLCDRVREKVDGIPAENILIGATHTHSGPDCYAFPDGQGGHTADLDYLDSVCEKTAEAINDALSQLRPATLKVNTDVAAERIAFNYYAPALYDRRMSVVQALGDDGRAIATLVNYANHPEVLGNGLGITSPDFVGPLCERIEQTAGGLALFMNGAQGGMITADNRDFTRPGDPIQARWPGIQTWDECIRIGHLMADEALRILSDAPEQADPPLECFAEDVTFPVESDDLWNVVLHSPLGYPRDEDDRTVTTRVNLVHLGNAQILTIPGEAMPNVGFYLKRKMTGEHNLLFGLTNDAFGYILARVDFNSFPRYDYVSRVSLGEQTGEIFMDAALDLVERHSPSQP